MRSAKQQALAALPKLQEVFPIRRAEMRFKFTVPSEFLADTLEMLTEQKATVESQQQSGGGLLSGGTGGVNTIVCTADPASYRVADKFVREKTVRTSHTSNAPLMYPWCTHDILLTYPSHTFDMLMITCMTKCVKPLKNSNK
jgi:hypothetical protein